MLNHLIRLIYHWPIKPLLFRLDPETVHDAFTTLGYHLGAHAATRQLTHRLFAYRHPALTQTIAGLNFINPVGLSAGFDYDAKMSAIMPSVGFAFESVGTVTHLPYAGNHKPRLARLPKTRSLLVNKGFKSAGIHQVLDQYLQKIDPKFILGLSIGATNSPTTSTPKTQIPDILESFKIIKTHPHYSLLDYLELNISCPNVLGAGTLATPKHLATILSQLDKLKLKKPLFIKFPIHVTDAEAIELVKLLVKHHVAAVIIGNLYKKRDSASFDPQDFEMIKNLKGNFSGKPTEKLSNHLISLVYQHFKTKIIIIGVGGIFTAEDVYEKIKRGATLVQLITGMVFEGPQLIGDLNRGLVSLLQKDGYSNIKEAVGKSP